MSHEALAYLYISQKSENTQRSYDYAFNQWIVFIRKKDEKMETATTKTVLEFVNQVRGRGQGRASDATVSQRFNALNAIYGFLQTQGEIDMNVFKRAKSALSLRQKHQVRPTKLIKSGKIKEAIKSVKLNTQDGVRDAALLSLLFGSGLRRSEALGLNVDDILSTQDGIPYIRIRHAKGGVGRDVAMPEWAWESFSMLVSQRKSEGAEEGDPIFVFYYKDKRVGKRLGISTLYRIYKGYMGAAPHSARATFATALLNQGLRDRDIAHAIGHSTTQQVQVYDKRARAVKDSVALNLKY